MRTQIPSDLKQRAYQRNEQVPDFYSPFSGKKVKNPKRVHGFLAEEIFFADNPHLHHVDNFDFDFVDHFNTTYNVKAITSDYELTGDWEVLIPAHQIDKADVFVFYHINLKKNTHELLGRATRSTPRVYKRAGELMRSGQPVLFPAYSIRVKDLENN